MPKIRRSNNKRELLLDVAESVAIRLGAANLTLDAVAKKAGVGKGGLMYHFPSKEALLQAMVARANDHYSQTLEAALTSPANRADFALAHIRSLTAREKKLQQLASVIITVAVHYPKLLRPLQERLARRYSDILKQHKNGSSAVIAMLAINGLFLMEHLGVSPLAAKNRASMVKQLCALVE